MAARSDLGDLQRGKTSRPASADVGRERTTPVSGGELMGSRRVMSISQANRELAKARPFPAPSPPLPLPLPSVLDSFPHSFCPLWPPGTGGREAEDHPGRLVGQPGRGPGPHEQGQACQARAAAVLVCGRARTAVERRAPRKGRRCPLADSSGAERRRPRNGAHDGGEEEPQEVEAQRPRDQPLSLLCGGEGGAQRKEGGGETPTAGGVVGDRRRCEEVSRAGRASPHPRE